MFFFQIRLVKLWDLAQTMVLIFLCGVALTRALGTQFKTQLRLVLYPHWAFSSPALNARLIYQASKKLQKSFKKASTKLQKSFKKASNKLQKSFKTATTKLQQIFKKLQKSFKTASKKLQKSFKKA